MAGCLRPSHLPLEFAPPKQAPTGKPILCSGQDLLRKLAAVYPSSAGDFHGVLPRRRQTCLPAPSHSRSSCSILRQLIPRCGPSAFAKPSAMLQGSLVIVRVTRRPRTPK